MYLVDWCVSAAADDVCFFTLIEGLQRHCVDFWLTYIARIHPFWQRISYCKMSLELQELVSIMKTENPSSWEKNKWTLLEKRPGKRPLISESALFLPNLFYAEGKLTSGWNRLERWWIATPPWSSWAMAPTAACWWEEATSLESWWLSRGEDADHFLNLEHDY